MSADAGGAQAAWDGVDVRCFTRLAHDAFASTLDAVAEAKTLLIDPTLAGPLGLVSDVATLKQHGVEKMFWLEDTGADSSARRINAPTRQVMYFCRPETRWMRSIAGECRHKSQMDRISPALADATEHRVSHDPHSDALL